MRSFFVCLSVRRIKTVNMNLKWAANPAHYKRLLMDRILLRRARLLACFGLLSSVLAARSADLIKVPGVRETRAPSLKATPVTGARATLQTLTSPTRSSD